MTLLYALAMLWPKGNKIQFRKIAGVIAILFAIALFNNPIYSQNKKGEGNSLIVHMKVPDEFWTKEFLFYVNGDTIRKNLSEHKGKVLILDFWSTTCMTCFQIMKEKESNFKKYPKNAKLIYVNSPKSRDTYQHILNSRDNFQKYTLEGNFESIIGSEYIDQLFPVYGYPSYIWIGADGCFLLQSGRAFVNASNLENALNIYKLPYE